MSPTPLRASPKTAAPAFTHRLVPGLGVSCRPFADGICPTAQRITVAARCPQRFSNQRRAIITAALPHVNPAYQKTAPKYLFEGRYGLPLVREFLSYGELLREIRTGRVDAMYWFPHGSGGLTFEGPCLVEFKDGVIKQAHVPYHDYRVPYAMESHGVQGHLLAQAPAAKLLAEPRTTPEWVRTGLTKVLPVVSIAAVYVAAQFAAYLKGDLEDRKKLRQKDVADKKNLKVEQSADAVAEEAEQLANMGRSAEEIISEMGRLGVEMTLDEAKELVAEAQARNVKDATSTAPIEIFNTEEEAAEQLAAQAERKKAAAEAEGGQDDMEKAEAMLSLSTMKIKKAAGGGHKKNIREQLKRRRRAKKGKGLNLQYLDEEEVFFDDVAGIGDAKVELMEVVDFFLKPDRFKASGCRIPQGVLLCGPPGTGKTLLARAVAGEAGVAFLSVNASEFVEMFVGVGAARVRDLFETAKSLAPAIIFIDEIDAVGRLRGGAKGNDERDQTLNQMLSCMDGFDSDSGVIVMGATNRKDVLDPALVRPGRFDRIIQVVQPSLSGRVEVLKVHLAKVPTDDTINDATLAELAFDTNNYSGAQLANLVNLGAVMATKRDADAVGYEDLVHALEYERLGPERAAYSDGRTARMATQEAATALAATLLPAIEPVVSCTVRPREKFPLGHTVLKVNEQREMTRLYTRRYLEEQLLMVLAGRAAEELVYGRDEMSSINQRRLVMARRIAQKLTVSGAMSDAAAIGNRTLASPRGMGGRTVAQLVTQRVSPATLEAVGDELTELLNDGYSRARDLLTRNRPALDALREALSTRLTLTGDEVREIVETTASEADLQARATEAGKFL